jgi:hypothetical protein
MASPICKKEKGRKKKNLREKKKKKKEVENIEIIEPPKKETTRQLVYHQILRSKYQQQLYAATPLFFVYHKIISTIQLRHHGVVLSGRKDFHCSLEPIADNLARVWRQMSDKRKRERRSRWIYLKRQRKMRKEKKKLTAL